MMKRIIQPLASKLDHQILPTLRSISLCIVLHGADAPPADPAAGPPDSSADNNKKADEFMKIKTFLPGCGCVAQVSA